MCCTKDLGKALDAWCNENGTAREDVLHVQLYGHQPPITRMNASDMVGLSSCEKLSLSSNAITKMQLSKSLRSLKVLSMGRNNLQRLDASLADVSGTLEELWISYNAVSKLDVGVASYDAHVVCMCRGGWRDKTNGESGESRERERERERVAYCGSY